MMVTDYVKAVLWESGVRVVDVLERVRRGLPSEEAGVTAANGKWVMSRLAELFE